MNKQDIQNILVFLSRVDLKGSEAIEFMRLQNVLVNFANNIKEEPVKEKK